MNTEHTPGPWRVLTKEEFKHTDDKYHCIIALDGPKSNAPGFSITGCISIHDARLIAAAPDLLQTLEDAIGSFELETDLYGFNRHQKVIDDAKTVVKRAKNG